VSEVLPILTLADVETSLIAASEEVLVLRGLAAADDLFRLGGDSLTIVRILLTLEARLGVTLDDDVYTGGDGRIGHIARTVLERLNA